MEIYLKYFGLIAECCQKSAETKLIAPNTDLKSLVILLEEQYSQLSNKSYKIAVNQKWVSMEKRLEAKDEVALLPPFSGG